MFETDHSLPNLCPVFGIVYQGSKYSCWWRGKYGVDEGPAVGCSKQVRDKLQSLVCALFLARIKDVFLLLVRVYKGSKSIWTVFSFTHPATMYLCCP